MTLGEKYDDRTDRKTEPEPLPGIRYCWIKTQRKRANSAWLKKATQTPDLGEYQERKHTKAMYTDRNLLVPELYSTRSPDL